MFHRKLGFSLLVLVSILTVSTLSCSSVSNLPNPFASATPTVTETFTPTVTPSPTPTPTSMPTATPVPTGVELQPQADGWTGVHDWDDRYELALPSDWVAIRLTKQDLDQIVQQMSSQDPNVGQMTDAVEGMDPETVRVFGLNKNAKYAKGSYPTMLVGTAIKDKLASSMPMEFVTAMIEDRVLTGSKDTTWDVKHNAHGVDVAVVQGSMRIPIQNGPTVSVKSKVIAFQSDDKLIMLEFVTPTQFGDEVLPGLDSIVDTIQLTKP